MTPLSALGADLLAVANPTSDLAASGAGIAALQALLGPRGPFSLAATFYDQLFLRENVGPAFLAARNRVTQDLGGSGALTGVGAIQHGADPSKRRRDLVAEGRSV